MAMSKRRTIGARQPARRRYRELEPARASRHRKSELPRVVQCLVDDAQNRSPKRFVISTLLPVPTSPRVGAHALRRSESCVRHHARRASLSSNRISHLPRPRAAYSLRSPPPRRAPRRSSSSSMASKGCDSILRAHARPPRSSRAGRPSNDGRIRSSPGRPGPGAVIALGADGRTRRW
jgi:hypothetical protein